MDASNITKRKQTGTLYTAYINQTTPVSVIELTQFSKPNTIPQVFQYFQNPDTSKYYNIQQYAANDFMTFELQNDVKQGAQVSGNTSTIISTFNTEQEAAESNPYVTPKSNLTFTTLPIICPNINFYQGTNYTSICK